MYKVTLVLCALLVLSSAFLEQHPLAPKPKKYENQQGCYIEELDTVVEFGKKAISKQRCVELRCYSDGVTVAGCGVVGAAPPCEVVTDPSLPYPDCCPKIKCPPLAPHSRL